MRSSIGWLLAVIACASSLFAQEAQAQIHVIERPAPSPDEEHYAIYDTWWVSWGLRDHDGYPLGIRRFRTKEAAIAAAQRALHETRGDRASAIKQVLIEGQATLRRKDGPTLPTFSQLAFEAALEQIISTRRSLTSSPKALVAARKANSDPTGWIARQLAKKLEPEKLGASAEEYAKQVAGAYERAKQLKEDLLANGSPVAGEVLQNVNDAIARHNAEIEKAKPELHFPEMTPVTHQMLDRAKHFREAARLLSRLTTLQAQLDAKRAQLQEERASIKNDSTRVAIEEVEQRRSKRSLSCGPYYLECDELRTDTSRRKGPFATYEEVLQAKMSVEPIRAEKSIRIVDSAGKKFDMDRYVPTDPLVAIYIGQRDLQLQIEREHLKARVANYQKEKGAYDTAMAEYVKSRLRLQKSSEPLVSLGYKQRRLDAPIKTKPTAKTKPAAKSKLQSGRTVRKP